VNPGYGVTGFTRVSDRLFRQVDFRAFYFFEDGILLEFLFDERFQFQHGRLKQRQRLLELRRKHHGLR
jgi:hypothetical protein